MDQRSNDDKSTCSTRTHLDVADGRDEAVGGVGGAAAHRQAGDGLVEHILERLPHELEELLRVALRVLGLVVRAPDLLQRRAHAGAVHEVGVVQIQLLGTMLMVDLALGHREVGVLHDQVAHRLARQHIFDHRGLPCIRVRVRPESVRVEALVELFQPGHQLHVKVLEQSLAVFGRVRRRALVGEREAAAEAHQRRAQHLVPVKDQQRDGVVADVEADVVAGEVPPRGELQVVGIGVDADQAGDEHRGRVDVDAEEHGAPRQVDEALEAHEGVGVDGHIVFGPPQKLEVLHRERGHVGVERRASLDGVDTVEVELPVDAQLVEPHVIEEVAKVVLHVRPVVQGLVLQQVGLEHGVGALHVVGYVRHAQQRPHRGPDHADGVGGAPHVPPHHVPRVGEPAGAHLNLLGLLHRLVRALAHARDPLRVEQRQQAPSPLHMWYLGTRRR